MFISAFFTIAKTWEKPRCPDEWIKKMWHAHTHKHTHTNLELVNEFFRFEGYKIKISKLIVFLYINNEQS